MDQFTKEGRKLRPRKTAGEPPRSEKVEYSQGSDSGERRPYDGPRRPYEERRPYGEGRQQYGEGRRPQYGEGRRPQYGENRRPYGENRENRGSYGNHGFSSHRSSDSGERRPYEERRSYGEGRPQYGERRSYGEGRPQYGERRPHGEGRPQYGENRSQYGEGRQQSGERRFYGGEGRENFSGERRSYGENRYGGPRKPQGYGKPRGPKKPGRKPNFTRESTEGINRMISRRPVVNGNESTEVPYPTPIRDTIRLNKFIANSGVCSRREADTLIQAGVVTVNGEVVTELGTKVNVFTDDIRFNGERLKGEEKVYIVMNKPAGFVTTASDPHAEKTVLDLVKGCSARVYPVGRLDKNTTGVLMLTNDGEIAERLTHPSYDKKKIYQVALDRPLSQEDFDKILAGVELTDGLVQADELEYIDPRDKRKLGIEIHSGKNRIVRRIFETLGYNVKALDRVYFAGLTKKGLKKGEWRYLTEGEANILKMGAYV
ncbi:MAG: pseudouridine synthase [Bacteroidales bacterium]|nr:pseudouridine synthase [Bacteroidales bacterium]